VFLSLSAPISRAACTPIPGADQLWSNPSLRWVLVGELHGTNETAPAFADLVCDGLAHGKHIIVALERPRAEQPIIDRILTERDVSKALQSKHASVQPNPMRDARMNSKKTKGLALKLRIILALLALGVSLGWVLLRRTYAPHGENVNEAALAGWWRIQLAYSGAFLFLLASGLFLPSFKRLKRSVLVISIANLFMTGLLLGLHFVTSDPLVRPTLSRLGLGWLSPVFLVLGVFWGVVFFYLFATEVDVSQHGA